MELAINQPINAEALDAELREALPGVFTGISVRKGAAAAHLEDDLDDDQLAIAQGIIKRHDASARSAAQQTAAGIRADAQVVVGVTVGELSFSEMRALLAALLYKAGGVDSEGKVAPLAQWLK